MQQALQEANLSALKLQMNPHFIFNTLNSLKALGRSGNIKSFEETIVTFANLLRSILKGSRENKLNLKEEIESLKNYLRLEQHLSQNRFDFEIIVNTNNIDIEEINIPPMLIQPFAENAIKHAFKERKGKITIQIIVKGKYLVISIKDNGIGFNTETVTLNSYGIKITKERISNLLSNHLFEISSSNIGTCVSFRIPLLLDY